VLGKCLRPSLTNTIDTSRCGQTINQSDVRDVSVFSYMKMLIHSCFSEVQSKTSCKKT
jgi:hypothetical protein